MPQLRILTGPHHEQIIPLDDGETVIGRAPECRVVLEPDSPASRRHASVFAAEDGGWHLRDLESANGTALNGGWIKESPLAHGDQFSVGGTEFLYEDAEARTADAAPAGDRAPADAIRSTHGPPWKPPRLPRWRRHRRAYHAARPRSMSERMGTIKAEIGKAIIGQTDIIGQLLMAIISNGHVLMIGMPGLAKTMLIRTVSEVLDMEFRRVQFTPDLMPSDITGTDILESDEATGKKEYRFIRGPIFTNILLADEINRTPPKTQAALLEAMQEHRVTAAGQTMTLTPPFFVLATQNPLEQEGTYPLPEAQLDRFMFSIYVITRRRRTRRASPR